MKVGFTGRREGLNSCQVNMFYDTLETIGNISEFHHGDCVGADAEAHDIVANLNEFIAKHIHPPEKQDLRAFCNPDAIYKPKSYFARNRDIVDMSDVMVACPPTDVDPGRGGTWYTINYARKQGKPIYICYPNGTVGKENFND